MATLYWVGGSSNWDGTAGTKWSLTSGGTGGQPVPTSSDDVVFDANSGTGTVTIVGAPIVNTRPAKSLTCTGFTGTISGSGGLDMYGNLTLSSGMTFNNTGTVVYYEAGTITSAGKTISALTINCSSGATTVTLGDNVAVSSFGLTQIQTGTLALNGKVLSTGSFRAVSSISSLVMNITTGTGGKIVLTGNNAEILYLQDSSSVCSFPSSLTFETDYTFSSGTRSFRFASLQSHPTIRIPSGSDTIRFVGGTYGSINFQGFFAGIGFSGTFDLYQALTIKGNLTMTTAMSVPASSNGITFAPASAQTSTVTSYGQVFNFNTWIDSIGGTVELNGNWEIGSIRTLTLARGTLKLNGYVLKCGLFSSNNSNTRSINWGGGSIELTNDALGATVLSMGTLTNFTSTNDGKFVRNNSAPKQRCIFICADGALPTSPETNLPAIQITGNVDVELSSLSKFKSIDATGFSAEFYSASTFNSIDVYGSCKLSPSLGASPSYKLAVTIRGSGSIEGMRGFHELTINGAGIFVSMSLDAYVLNNCYLVQGSLSVIRVLNCLKFISSNSNSRTLNLGYAGVGVLNIRGEGTDAFDCTTSTNLTVSGSGTIKMESASTKYFKGGTSITYPTLEQAGLGTLFISGTGLTFGALSNSYQPASIQLPASQTTTVNNFNLAGTAGNLVTVRSASPSLSATLSKSSGAVTANYLALIDITATGGALWYVDLTTTTVGSNVSGWQVNPKGLMSWFS